MPRQYEDTNVQRRHKIKTYKYVEAAIYKRDFHFLFNLLITQPNNPNKILTILLYQTIAIMYHTLATVHDVLFYIMQA